MEWRRLTPNDLDEALAIGPGNIGHEIVGRERAAAAWRWLLQQRSFQGAVYFEPGSPRMLGVAASVFVKRSFAKRERQSPEPGLNARIIASIDSGQPVVLSLPELAADNRDGVLNLVVLYSHWHLGVTQEQRDMVKMLIGVSYLELHGGYRLEQIVTEIVGPCSREYVSNLPSWKVVTTFDNFFAGQRSSAYERERALGVVTKETSMAEAGTVAMSTFLHKDPTLGLTDADQTLLLAALRYLSDDEIAEELGISKAAVRWRWAQLFQRVSLVRPDLIGPSNGDRRGEGKRSRILGFVRTRPEELRPYAVNGRAAPARSRISLLG